MMSVHNPVLLKETIKLLNLKKGDTVVDATLGGGGHSFEILERIGSSGKLIAIDADEEATRKFKAGKNVFLVNDNFVNLEEILTDLKIEKVNAILADLGWSSDQLSGKGMSFLKDEPLDMRLNEKQELNARQVVNEYSEKELGRIIREFGEDRFWKNIARRIVFSREKKKIETTKELSEIVKQAIPGKYRHRKIYPATKTFQALRIEINRELENLKKFIPQAVSVLDRKGRLGIISFHSLEDRIVKNSFRENARGCICPPDFPQCACGKKPNVSLVTKKPVVPGEEEIKNNPRARSAKLRVCEKKQINK